MLSNLILFGLLYVLPLLYVRKNLIVLKCFKFEDMGICITPFANIFFAIMFLIINITDYFDNFNNGRVAKKFFNIKD